MEKYKEEYNYWLKRYYNGIKLFPNINFTLRESSIELLGFESEIGDLFTFEVTQIVPVNR